MVRSLALLVALALAPVTVLPSTVLASERSLSMRFDLRRPYPAAARTGQCRGWIAASGAITEDTPHDFQLFVKGRDVRGLTVALDSEGGSVLGAIGLGREIRRLALNTTVGRVIDITKGDEHEPFAVLSPRADCQSMCAFVLLAGVHRIVPPEARVMVHQIWLGDRREDPTAANYSAEDLVLVQHDIGSLAQYTVDMGASIDLLGLALRIPPWEPMHTLTADEISRMHVATDAALNPALAMVAASPPAAAETTPLVLPMSNAAGPTALNEQRWALTDHAGMAALARHHPLTIGGEYIGSFDLRVACGDANGYDISYAEIRHAGDLYPLPGALTAVTLTVGNKSAPLKVMSSRRSDQPDELITIASAAVPASLISAFAAAGNHSLTIVTKAGLTKTGIRLGNTGALTNLPRLAAMCPKPLGERAVLTANKIGGGAVAK